MTAEPFDLAEMCGGNLYEPGVHPDDLTVTARSNV